MARPAFSGRFTRGSNGGTKRCRACNTLTQAGIIDFETDGTGLCRTCFTEANDENSHSDGHHRQNPSSTCLACQEAVG